MEIREYLCAEKRGTVFIRLWAAAYKFFFIILCRLQSRAAYNPRGFTFFYLAYRIRKVEMTLSLSLATFR